MGREDTEAVAQAHRPLREKPLDGPTNLLQEWMCSAPLVAVGLEWGRLPRLLSSPSIALPCLLIPATIDGAVRSNAVLASRVRHQEAF